MCAACVEYIKDKLTDKEFKSALRETTVEDAAHAKQVEALIRETGDQSEELKKKLKQLNR